MGYILMNKDEKLALLDIEVDKNNKEELVYRVKYKGLPIWLMDINKWLKYRVADRSRENIGKLYKSKRIHNLDTLIRITKCLSLNDTLWIRGEDEWLLRWGELSLYRNNIDGYCEEISLYGESNKYSVYNSPEYTTRGINEKCWSWDYGKHNLSLIKRYRNSEIDGYKGNGAFSEYYSNIISKDILGLKEGIDYIKYDVECLRFKEYVSKSKCFTSEEYGYVPIGLLIQEEYNVEAVDRYMGSINSYSSWLYRNMIVLDYLTMNTNRNLGSFGVIIDNSSLKVLRMAPIFNNNDGLYSDIDITGDKYSKCMKIISGLKPKCSKSFDIDLYQVVGDWLDVDKKSIEFNRVDGIHQEMKVIIPGEGMRLDICDGISERRLEALEYLTNKRLEGVLRHKRLKSIGL